MIKKTLTILTIILFAINTYSVTLEELIDSYNFSYQDPNINFEILNKTLKNNSLNIELNFEILYGEYELISRLYSKNTPTKILNSTKRVLKDNKKINLTLNTSELISSNYSYQLVIKKDERIIYRNYNLFEIEIINPNINMSENLFFDEHMTIEDLPKIEEEKIKLADVKVKSFSYNNTNNIINITLENIGDKYIGPFYYWIHDDTFEIIEEKYVEFLRKNETIEHLIQLKNKSKEFVIYLDSYHFYEEKDEINNLYFWPEEKKENTKIESQILTSSGGSKKKKENSIVSQTLIENSSLKKENLKTTLLINKTSKEINNENKPNLIKVQKVNISPEKKVIKNKSTPNEITGKITSNTPKIISTIAAGITIIGLYLLFN